MPATEHTFNAIANAYYEQGRATVPLEEILRSLDLWEWTVPKKVLKDALAVRGLTLANDEISETGDTAPLIPVKTGYEAFIRAAKDAIEMVEKPVSAGELIGMTGLATEAVPAESLAYHLRRAGIYYIPGVGFWRYPQFATVRGELLATPGRSKKARRIAEAFKEHGWPLAGEEVERITAGEVSSRFMSQQAHKKAHRMVATIGNSLFVPAGIAATSDMPVPVTHNVVAAILDHSPSKPLFRDEDVKLYKLAAVLARHGLATVRQGWSRRHGRQTRIVFMELTETGHRLLTGLDRRTRKDEF